MMDSLCGDEKTIRWGHYDPLKRSILKCQET